MGPMPRYVGFLRGINVGGHIVKMDRLRSIFASLGFERVETFIASGNVVFDAASDDPAELERTIEAGLRAALGYEVATFLRSLADLAAVAAHRPFAESEGHSLYVLFLVEPPIEEAARTVVAYSDEVNALAVRGREVYWLRRKAISDREFPPPPLEKVLVGPVTSRNVNTVRRMAARYAASGP